MSHIRDDETGPRPGSIIAKLRRHHVNQEDVNEGEGKQQDDHAPLPTPKPNQFVMNA